MEAPWASNLSHILDLGAHVQSHLAPSFLFQEQKAGHVVWRTGGPPVPFGQSDDQSGLHARGKYSVHFERNRIKPGGLSIHETFYSFQVIKCTALSVGADFSGYKALKGKT